MNEFNGFMCFHIVIIMNIIITVIEVQAKFILIKLEISYYTASHFKDTHHHHSYFFLFCKLLYLDLGNCVVFDKNRQNDFEHFVIIIHFGKLKGSVQSRRDENKYFHVHWFFNFNNGFSLVNVWSLVCMREDQFIDQ